MTYGDLKSRALAGSLISLLVIVGTLLPASAKAGALADLIMLLGKNAEASSSAGSNSSVVYNVQTMELPRGAYNIDPNPSKGGGDITIVDGSALVSEEGPAGTSADISETELQSHQISVYVVRPGDTLSDIAELFNVTVSTIMWSNDITRGEALQVGSKLTILPITGVRHTVKSGETLASIAEKYNGHLEEIESYNGISASASLAVGTEIIIPDGEIAAPKQAARTTRRTSSAAHAASGPTYAGYYLRPIVGGVRTQGIHGYNGVDIAASVGTPVLAAAAGEVIISREGGWNGGYGSYVVISHGNGTQTLYAHNSSNIVSAGQWVVQGQVIGYVGSTGRSTGPHVHFEIRGARNPF